MKRIRLIHIVQCTGGVDCYLRMLLTPIVATEVNAIPELIVDHENGLLVPCDDDYSAAEAVLKIYKDSNMKDRFVRNGMMRCRTLFDIRRVAMEHELLITRISEVREGRNNSLNFYAASPDEGRRVAA